MNFNLHGRGRAKWKFHGHLARFLEGQETPTQIWEKREGEERGHMA